MKVLITGGSGLIGSALAPALESAGHAAVVLGRRGPNRWDPAIGGDLPAAARGADAVISLAGENVAQRWTPAVRQAVRESRVAGTRPLIQARDKSPPRVFVSASATGYYGDRGDEELTEASPAGTGFLAEVCRDWESAADSAGMRVVKVRLGVVLDPRGGALGKMLPAFRLGLGARLGSGLQWMPWVHRQDAVSLLMAALGESFAGVYNACAPQPVRNVDFARALGRALRRPVLLRIPRLALQAMFGEMSGVLLGSQRVLPRATAAAGFQFQFPQIDAALLDLVGPAAPR